MMDENKPPVIVEEPPAAAAMPKPAYPETFVNARWRLGIIGGVGVVGILAATPILFAPTGGGSYVGVFAVFAGLFSILIVYALLHLGSKWTLYEDRLEYRSFFGSRRAIRKLDALSFGPDWTGIRSVLRDAHSAIPVGWEINRCGYLCDILRTWAPRTR
jgi:hypothetical protein